jgi:bacteriocin-like protein
MDTTPMPTELEVLSDDELAQVVGGADKVDREWVLNKIGMCGCGRNH